MKEIPYAAEDYFADDFSTLFVILVMKPVA